MSIGFGETSKSKRNISNSRNLFFAKEEQQAFNLLKANKLNEAATIYKKLIKAGHKNCEIYTNLGLIEIQQSNFLNAIKFLNLALLYQPDNINILSRIAFSYHQLRHFSKAKDVYQKSISINNKSEELFFNYAELQKDAGDVKSAIKLYEKGIEISAINYKSLSNLGALYEKNKEFKKAIDVYKKAIELAPNVSHLKVDLISCKSFICDWTDILNDINLLNNIGLEGDAISPFEFLPLEDNPFNSLIRAKRFYQDRYKREEKSINFNRKKKIRIGYFSADFYRHATMYLMQRIFEFHNKTEFEIFIYSASKFEDELTEKLKKNVDVFKDISDMEDIEAVMVAREDQIDIAIDLKGYTQNTSLSIFSYRIAPIQVSYLGYPGTTGADCIDYLIADKIIIPNENKKFYTEKVLYMPNSYQCNDSQRKISNRSFKREELGLKDDDFVFACFNANNKITKDVFTIWMNLLSKVEGSVLWLYRSNKFSEKNLCKEATRLGIDSARIVFADKISHDEHLSRLRCADLFLDTFYYNAHTTASDALWAGIPIITKLGESFSARVCSSLLTAVGLPELIAHNSQEYENKAFNLAINEKELKVFKKRLKENLLTYPLFDSKKFTKDLEKIYSDLIQNL